MDTLSSAATRAVALFMLAALGVQVGLRRTVRVIAGMGLGVILTAHVRMLWVLKGVSATYLTWLAWSLWQAAGQGTADTGAVISF